MAVAQHLVRETEVLVALRPVREKAGLRRLAVTAAGIAAAIVGLQAATVDRRAVRVATAAGGSEAAFFMPR
jgi:hypothetical protein